MKDMLVVFYNVLVVIEFDLYGNILKVNYNFFFIMGYSEL